MFDAYRPGTLLHVRSRVGAQMFNDCELWGSSINCPVWTRRNWFRNTLGISLGYPSVGPQGAVRVATCYGEIYVEDVDLEVIR